MIPLPSTAGYEALEGPALSPKAQIRARAEEVAKQFETIFTQSMVGGMRETANMGVGEGLFGEGPGTDTYTAWFDQYMSEHLSREGSIGLTDTLMRQFEELGQVPSLEEIAEEGATR